MDFSPETHARVELTRQDCKRSLLRPIETKDTKATQQRIAGR